MIQFTSCHNIITVSHTLTGYLVPTSFPDLSFPTAR